MDGQGGGDGDGESIRKEKEFVQLLLSAKNRGK